MKSATLGVYKKWLGTATPEQIEFVDGVYAVCEKHYEEGGSAVVECYGPKEILESFKSIEEVRELCGLRLEQALNCRWGEDNDPQVDVVRKFDQGGKWGN